MTEIKCEACGESYFTASPQKVRVETCPKCTPMHGQTILNFAKRLSIPRVVNLIIRGKRRSVC